MNEYPHRTLTVGRLVITSCRQGAAPIIDGCHTRAKDGWTAGGWCIRPARTPGRGLIVAWKGWDGPSHQLIRRLCTTPVLRRLFLRPVLRRPR